MDGGLVGSLPLGSVFEENYSCFIPNHEVNGFALLYTLITVYGRGSN